MDVFFGSIKLVRTIEMKWNVCAIIIMGVFGAALAQSVNDSITLVKDLQLKYYGINKSVRPVKDQNKTIYVNCTLVLNTIKSFDEVHGIMLTVASVSLSWTDELMTWDPAQYGGISMAFLPNAQVWIPEITILNPAETLQSICNDEHMVGYYNDGTGFVSCPNVLSSYCKADVRYYPFDVQTCSIGFVSTYYGNKHIRLLNGGILPVKYTELTGWELTQTKSYTFKLAGEIFGVIYELTLKRRPLFIIVNIIIPVVILGLLNTQAFLVPMDSGERVSYCITVLLSITVFITFISDTLPRNTTPLPIICYKLILDLGTSALITIVSIWNIRLSRRCDS